MNENELKIEKTVFIIMPFSKVNNRNQEQLTNFFEALRSSIEAEKSLSYKYTVRRSGDDLIITDQLIRSLFNADIVIADISGEVPNPNVMYELGVRLAISEKPVILIREGDKSESSDLPFDLKTYHTEFYDPFNHEKLVRILVNKLKRIERGEMQYESPVKKALLYSNDQAYNIFSKRERLRTFCSHVVGKWWQLITEKSVKEEGKREDSLSYINFKPDEVTNEVRISGDTYTKKGMYLGHWESLAVGIIMEQSPKIFYYWEAKHEEPGKKTSGFGEFDNFEPSEDVFTHARGRFMNTNLFDKRKSWWKQVSIKRILKEEHIRKMDGRILDKKRLVVEDVSEKWDTL